MSAFEFCFSLFGLVLGLSVTEVIGGFARVLRARQKVRLGWLTPLLALLLLVDLVTFWTNTWDMREMLSADFGTLLFGTAVAAIYFLAASLVFPAEVEAWPDLDTYFLRHKGQVILGVWVANLLVSGAEDWIIGDGPQSWRGVVIPIAFTGCGVVLMIARSRLLSGLTLGVLLSLYAIFPFF